MTRVLLIDDDPRFTRALTLVLNRHGYQTATAATGVAGLQATAIQQPQLILLDLALPDVSGVEVLTGLHGWTTAPVIVLSARTDSADKVDALDAGATDYVTKPVGTDELLARIRAVVRRNRTADSVVHTRSFTVDLAARRVVRNGAGVHLTRTEWALLEALVRRRGELVSRDRLLTEVWGPQYVDATNYLRVYLASLRRKLEDEPARPRHLLTVARLGYRFES